MLLRSFCSFSLMTVVACGSTDDGDTGGGPTTASDASAGSSATDSATAPDSATGDSGPGGADPATVDACKTECAFMLEFDCIDADEHEDCFVACGDLGQDEVELFLACTDASPLCGDDPAPRRECLANFLDIDQPSDTGDTGPGDPTCVEACNDYLAMPCDPPIEGVASCEEFCGMLSAPFQQAAVVCLMNADGCDLPEGCTFPSE